MNHILLLALLLLLIGCSSEQKSGSGSLALSRQAVVYQDQVDSVEITRVSPGDCSSQALKKEKVSLEKLVASSNGCVSKKNWTLLESLTGKIIQDYPDSPWGSYYLSLASESQGNFKKALWMIDLSIKKSPKIGILRYQRGRILWEMDMASESIEEIQRSLSLDKKLTASHLFLGQVQLQRLDFKKSSEHFEQALKLGGKNLEVQEGLISSYIEEGRKEEALELSKRSISQFPRHAGFRLQEAYLYEVALNQGEQALQKYKQVKSLYLSKKLNGPFPEDLNIKIQSLEKVYKDTPRKLANKERGEM